MTQNYNKYRASCLSSLPCRLCPPAPPDDFDLLLELAPVLADEPDLSEDGLVGDARRARGTRRGHALGHFVWPLGPAAVALDEVVAEALLLAFLVLLLVLLLCPATAILALAVALNARAL
jgi:hypothetical protein